MPTSTSLSSSALPTAYCLFPIPYCQHLNHRRKDTPSICRSQQLLARPVRMRHHSQHIPSLIQNPGNVVERPVWIGLPSNFALLRCVPESDPIFCREAFQRLRIAIVIPFHVSDRDLEHRALCQLIRKRAVRRLHAQLHLLADVFEPCIAHQRAGQQPRLGQYLEPVANSQHQPAAGGKLLHRLHYRRKTRNGSRP